MKRGRTVYAEELILDPENRRLKAKCDAFFSLAKERHTSLDGLDSWSFSEKVGNAMKGIDLELEKTRTWKDLWGFQQSALRDDFHRHLFKKALAYWRSPEVVEKDNAFATRAVNVLPQMNPDFIGLDSSILENSYFKSAVNELQELNTFHTPDEIVQILSRCKTFILSESHSQTFLFH